MANLVALVARQLGLSLLLASCARTPAATAPTAVADRRPTPESGPIKGWNPDSPDACIRPRFADSGRSLLCGSPSNHAASCFSGFGAFRFPPLSDGGVAPPAKVDAGVAPAGSRGSLDKEIIRTIIRRHIDEVKFCYESKLVTRPGLGGRVVIQFVIDAHGAVTTSQVQGSTMGDADVETCIGKAVCGWTFPKPLGGGIVIISYPFVLTPA